MPGKDVETVDKGCSIALDALAMVYLLVLILTQQYQKRRDHVSRLYFTIVACICLFLALDLFYSLLYGTTDPNGILLMKLCKSLYFVLNAVLVWLWATYLDCILFGSLYYEKKHRIIYTAVLTFNLTTVAVNLFAGVLFDISDEGTFVVGGVMLWVFTLLNYLTVFVAECVLILKRRLVRWNNFLPLLLFALPPMVAEILQIAFRSVSLICAYSISALLIFQVSQNNTICTDELTGLANRRMLNDTLQKWFGEANGSMVCGIMLDLDGLKTINDRYGHPAGDNALINMAEVISRADRRGLVSIRYGGDEFMMVWLSKDGSEMEQTRQLLLTQKEKLNATLPEQERIDFSMGEFCCRDNGQYNAEGFLRVLDERMYRNKKAKKAAMATVTAV